MMREFKISSEGLKQLQKQLLFRFVLFMVIAVCLGIAIGVFNSKSKELDISVLLLIIAFITCILGFSFYQGFKQQKSLLKSFTLTITNNIVGREQLNTPIIAIYHNDIREIVKSKNGTFTIKGKESVDVIYIPAQIENAAVLEEELNKIRPVVIKSTTHPFQKCKGLISLLIIGLMLSVYTVNNKIIVAITGTSFVAILLWSLIYVQRSKNVDRKTKRNFWWIIPFLASVTGAIIMKLTA